MRLLFISNLYPPFGSGGYEQACQETLEGLRQRGHEIAMLTSRPKKKRALLSDPDWMYRELFMEMEFASLVHGLRFFTSRAAREQANLDCLEGFIRSFSPDLIFIWGMWNLPRSLPAHAERLMPGRVVYYMADYWATLPSQHEFYWRAPAQSWLTRLPKDLLKPLARRMLNRLPQPALQFARVILPSAFLRDELVRRGVCFGEARVIHGGVDIHLFTGQERFPRGAWEPGDGLTLLCAGRISPEKGIQTAIQAMEDLVHRRGIHTVKLLIAGGGEQGYVAQLRQAVHQANLEDYITFLGLLPKETMPDLYRKVDVFLFTSTWQEPFGRVLVEALAAGVVVVGTATGGSAEILGENVLAFAPGDAAGLADQILRLLEQPALRRQLIESGKQRAVRYFDNTRMVDEIEVYLSSVLEQQA